MYGSREQGWGSWRRASVAGHARVTGILVALIMATVVAALAPAAASAQGAPGTVGGTDALSGSPPGDVVTASSAPGSHWSPEPARYGAAATNDVPVTMSDGTVLRANIVYPTNPATGQEASGRFPVLLTQTPYGKGSGTAPGTAGGADPYLVDRGYIEVVADVRGTGDSEGTWGIFDPVQTQDSVTLIHWAARLAHSSGVVGTYGPSYLAINQMLAAGAVGKHSPLKAIFPVVSADEIYRDTTFMGGILDFEFSEAYLGLTGSLNAVNPLTDQAEYPDPAALTPVEVDHQKALASYYAATSANILTDGDEAYDGTYWQQRAPRNVLASIVANGIPAYLVGGEYDIFQRGEPLNYSGLQNAYDGRSVSAAMSPTQRLTGRYQLLVGPWTHLVASSVDYDTLELEWFDTWLKGERTGMARTPTPMHIYDLGTGRYAETGHYPYAPTSPTRFYLGGGGTQTSAGTLSASSPSTQGSDTMAWLPASSPCKRSVDQWSMGAGVVAAQEAGVNNSPCLTDDSSSALGPGSLSYTTAPLSSARTLTGPADLTVYATSTTADSEWTAELEDVSPSGTAKPLTEGALLGIYRQTDPSLSWQTSNGQLLLPYHPYTQASVDPATPGAMTRYDVEIFPTFATIPAGDRLRVTIASADTPHLAPTPPQQAGLTGGVYQLHSGGADASALEVTMGSPGAFESSAANGSTRCPSASGRLSGRTLGRVKLGMSRSRVRSLFRRVSTRRRRYMDYFCLARGGIRVVYASPAVVRGLPRRSRKSTRNHAVLALTANSHYALRGVRPGTRLARVRRKLKAGKGFHIGLNWWYVTPNGASRGVLKVRRGRIEEIGITEKQLTKTRRADRRLLSSFG